MKTLHHHHLSVNDIINSYYTKLLMTVLFQMNASTHLIIKVLLVLKCTSGEFVGHPGASTMAVASPHGWQIPATQPTPPFHSRHLSVESSLTKMLIREICYRQLLNHSEECLRTTFVEQHHSQDINDMLSKSALISSTANCSNIEKGHLQDRSAKPMVVNLVKCSFNCI